MSKHLSKHLMIVGLATGCMATIAHACDPGFASVASESTCPCPTVDTSTNEIAMALRGVVPTVNVSIVGFAFNPGQLIIPTDTNVRWTMNDQFTSHTVTSDSPPPTLDSPALGTGATYDHLFAAIGAFPYHCAIHPFMEGGVNVRLPGDATGDNSVNLSDFTILAANFGTVERTYAQGDFNVDTQVNLADFTILAANFGTSASDAPRSAVPEPASIGTLSLAAAALAARRRRGN